MLLDTLLFSVVISFLCHCVSCYFLFLSLCQLLFPFCVTVSVISMSLCQLLFPFCVTVSVVISFFCHCVSCYYFLSLSLCQLFLCHCVRRYFYVTVSGVISFLCHCAGVVFFLCHCVSYFFSQSLHQLLCPFSIIVSVGVSLTVMVEWVFRTNDLSISCSLFMTVVDRWCGAAWGLSLHVSGWSLPLSLCQLQFSFSFSICTAAAGRGWSAPQDLSLS